MTLWFLKELRKVTHCKAERTRAPWLLGAFDYRKEMNLKQNWPLCKWKEEEKRESKISGTCIEVRTLGPFQPVKNKIRKYFEGVPSWLSLLQILCCHCCGASLDSWPGNFCIPWAQPKNKRTNKQEILLSSKGWLRWSLRVRTKSRHGCHTVKIYEYIKAVSSKFFQLDKALREKEQRVWSLINLINSKYVELHLWERHSRKKNFFFHLFRAV